VLTDEGFEDYCETLGLYILCIGMHRRETDLMPSSTYEFMHLHGGPPMTANLGDGGDVCAAQPLCVSMLTLLAVEGPVVRASGELRQPPCRNWHPDACGRQPPEVRSPFVASVVQEELTASRMWRQDGPQANTGALFLALSMTENLRQHHKTTEDGYNRGRSVWCVYLNSRGLTSQPNSDGFVELALAGGKKSRKGHHYETTVEHVEGLFCNNDYQFDHGRSILLIGLLASHYRSLQVWLKTIGSPCS
jgi:hypothetical protein